MSGIATFATAPTVQAIAWALVHFLWQGALVGLAAAVALRHLRSRSASARYALAVGALLALLALPVATSFWIGGSAGTELSGPGAPGSDLPVRAANLGTAPNLTSPAILPASGFDLSALRAALSPTLPWIFGLWLAGVALLAVYHLGGWRQARRLAGSGRPLPAELEARVLDLGRRLGIARAVRLLESTAVSVPAVIGWLKPVILVPLSSLVGLSSWQLEAVLAHELAHVRRHDALVNLLQAALETLLFFHPAVWWISGEVRKEREHCCDDLAVAVCGDRLSYARALADLEGLRAPLPRLALAADGGSLLDRVRRLVGAPARPAGRSWLAGLLALSILPFGLTLQSLQWNGGGTRFAANGAGGGVSLAPQRPAAAEGGARRSEEANETTTGAGGSGQTTTGEARRGSWTATRQGDRVDLESTMSWKSVGESHRWHVGETYEAKDLVGLTAGPDVRFELRREAGTFLFEGRFGGAKGSGTFTFQPNPAYPREMATLGYTVEPERQMEMAIQDVSVSFAREIKSLGFRDTTLDQLVQLRIQGVTAEYARALGGLGIADLSAEQLIQLKIQGVSPDWVRGLNTAGYRDLSADQLVQLKIQGVSAEWVQGLTAAGSGDLSADELVQLRIQGVSAEWVRGLADAGYRDLSPDQLVQLKIQGVSGAWVRELADAGFPRGSADELVQLKIQGVTGPFVRQAVSRYGKLSADDLVRLKISGRLDR
ncbi:MAG TPA: M56 family metallopeptidase [Thermoanaerobaculia bacterium]|jgi:beta-lactamase regulating signal transducer with metallopeptidase domain|nr:M56 family metallopeptidase [Thermoanaerobaculia bacterium]